MGMWDYINSATDNVKRNAPDLTPVRNACWSSYDFSRASVAKIDHAVRENVVPTLKHHLSDDEGRAKLGRFAASFAKTAAIYGLQEGIKCVPGGASVYNIASRSLCDRNTEDYKQVVKTLQARIDKLERESSGCKNNQAEMLSCDVKFDSRSAPCLDSYAHQKPEDMIRIFMMKEFCGTYMFGDLVVPGVRHGKKSIKEP